MRTEIQRFIQRSLQPRLPRPLRLLRPLRALAAKVLSTVLATALATTLAATLAACAQTPRLDSRFGASLRLAQAQQTLNPEAGRNRDPVNGLDAQAAKSAYDSYQRSYAAPDQNSNSFTLGSVSTAR